MFDGLTLSGFLGDVTLILDGQLGPLLIVSVAFWMAGKLFQYLSGVYDSGVWYGKRPVGWDWEDERDYQRDLRLNKR